MADEDPAYDAGTDEEAAVAAAEAETVYGEDALREAVQPEPEEGESVEQYVARLRELQVAATKTDK